MELFSLPFMNCRDTTGGRHPHPNKTFIKLLADSFQAFCAITLLGGDDPYHLIFQVKKHTRLAGGTSPRPFLTFNL